MEDADLREKVAHLEEREKSNTHRIDEHDKQIRKLSDVYVENDVSEMKEDLKEIKEKPRQELG